MALADQNVMKQQMTMEAPVIEAKDLTTKEYVDNKIAGTLWDPVKAATTANLAGNYASGVLAGASNGALAAIDTVSLAVGDRVLLKDQTDASQNGIYEVTEPGDASSPWELTRAADADEAGEFKPGKQVYVLPGMVANANGDRTFKLTTASAIVVGSTAVEFAIALPDMLMLNSITITGNPAVTEYTITHTVNSRNVQVQAVRTDVTPNAVVHFGVFILSATQIKLTCNPPLEATETYRITIVGLPDA